MSNLPVWMQWVGAAGGIGIVFALIELLFRRPRRLIDLYNAAAIEYRNYLLSIMEQLTTVSTHDALPAAHDVLLTCRADIVRESERFKISLPTKHEQGEFDEALSAFKQFVDDEHGWREAGPLAYFSSVGTSVAEARANEATAKSEARGYLQRLLGHAEPR